MNQKRLLLGCLAAILTTSFAICSFASASTGVGGRPAKLAPDNPRAQSIFLYSLKSGEVKTDSIFLSNNSDKEQTIEIYPVDGTITNLGSYTCRDQTDKREGVGSWINLKKSRVTIPAKGDVTIEFEVSMPEVIDSREYNGCIVWRSINVSDQDSESKRVVTPQAVRMAIVVPGDLRREVTVGAIKRRESAKSTEFDLNLVNKGNVSADVDINLVTTDLFGRVVGTDSGEYAVLGDSSLQLAFNDNSRPFWGGLLSTRAMIAYDKRAGVYGVIDGGQLQRDTSQTLTYFVWPSPWAIVALAIGLLTVVGTVVWTKQQKNQANHEARQSLGEPGVTWIKYRVKNGDTLESLANERKASVSKLSTINKLSSSAILQEGQYIYVPKQH